MVEQSQQPTPIEQILRYYQAYKVFVLDPHNGQQSRFIADLSRLAPCPVYYFEVGLHDTTLAQIVRSLADSFSRQQPRVAHLFRRAAQQFPLKPTNCGQDIAQAMGHLYDSDHLVLIQDFDRTDVVTEFNHFMEALILNLPGHCHLVLSGRSMPALPWAALIARRQALFLSRNPIGD